MTLYRIVLRTCTAIGIASSLAGIAAIVYALAAAPPLPGGVPGVASVALGGLLLASGLAAAAGALLLDSAETELSRLRHERDVLEAERESQRSRLRGLERRAESLSLVREIHRCTNIIARGERLRQLLSVIGRLGEEVEAALFARDDPAGAAAPDSAAQTLRPIAYLRVGPSGELFLGLDRPISTGATLSVADASSISNGPRRELAATVVCDLDRVGRLEASVTGPTPPKAEEALGTLLASVDLDCGAAAGAVEHGQVIRQVHQGKGLPHDPAAGPPVVELLYPLAAEGSAIGALRVRLPVPLEQEECRGLGDLEDILAECARHVALALKKESDVDRAETDALTGLFVRRSFELKLAEAVREAVELSRPVSLLVVDIDHFKRVNDTYGHRSGDQILKGVSGLLRRHIRACDSAFRYGGEEICVLLPGTGSKEAASTAERLRSAVESASFSGDASQKIAVTISVGVAEFDPRRLARSRQVEPPRNFGSRGASRRQEDAKTRGNALSGSVSSRSSEGAAAELFRRADAAVYSAKRSGRNRVVVWRARLRTEGPARAGASGATVSGTEGRVCRESGPEGPCDTRPEGKSRVASLEVCGPKRQTGRSARTGSKEPGCAASARIGEAASRPGTLRSSSQAELRRSGRRAA